MKASRGTWGAKAFLVLVAAVVVGAAGSAALVIHGMRAEKPPAATAASPAPVTTPSEDYAQPTPQTLPMPHYPSRSSCGRKGEPNGLDPQRVLGFEGLCIPLVVPPAEYGKWNSGEKGDWEDSHRHGRANFCDPARGCTSVDVYRYGEAYFASADCGEKPSKRDELLVDGYHAVHALFRQCGANRDQFQHIWAVETPEGSVVVVAESPDTMDPGKEDGSATPARVGESMTIARVFDTG